MTITVRHSTASGRLDECWDFDVIQQRIEALVRMGGVSVPLEILVCSQERPRVGAHPILRVDSESWRVLPARYVVTWPHRSASLCAVSCPIGDVLAPGQHLILIHAPPTVSAELAAL